MSRVADWIRPEILAAKPYQVADARGLIKLDAMEAPSGPPADVQADWQTWLGGVDWHRYPDGTGQGVKQALRAHFEIGPELGILLGNGSDEIIQMLTLALARPRASLLTPAPGFAIYGVAARTAGMAIHYLALDETDFSLDPDAAIAAIERHQPALVFIANPNNPTGNFFPRETLHRLAEATPGLLVVDEAYFPHSRAHCLDMAGRPDNLAVMRTLSKAGMAGLRLGWLVADPAWIDALERIRMPYNINAFTQAAAEFALKQPQWWQALAAELRERRDRLVERLGQDDRVQVWPSEANFVLLRVPDAVAVFEGMKAEGVLVKCLHGQHPALQHCLRLTVGSETENEHMLAALDVGLRAC
ncbi:histidinol-phosphate aminotransferase [Natronospira proteinivora]|uniref:Histidinol-phosphate aminotransferase n=1 Tax=Natronospira proteinivora TaxID=1807133 RepID=A0ABT1G569_9GAMM|nr:histidinol-phosphate transaminase [Natronospira proteinivora]MCP1726085.1 histidinol-phosphate aminotransferase [Natronospira proteinivora]